MRLLITTDTIGGVWTFTQELVAGLLEREFSVLLVSFGRMPSPAHSQQCDSLARRFGRSFRYVPSDVALEWMEANERAFVDGAELLEREAAAFAPDLIHSNQFCYGAMDMPVPALITAHSDVLSWAKACRPAPLPNSPWLQSYVAQVQAGLSGADAVAAPTHWMMHALEDSFRMPEARRVIPNGRRISAQFEGARRLQAVTAGRIWDEAKGMATLKSVNSPIPIVIAGEPRLDGSSGAEGFGRAHVLGRLSDHEILELLRRSMIYLCLSVYEPFGLAALEAGRCGCAVIARDIPSLREVWGDGALYFAAPAGLSEVLGQLSRDAAMLEQARRRSFERSLNFSRDRMVEGYLGLYQQVLTTSARAEHVA